MTRTLRYQICRADALAAISWVGSEDQRLLGIVQPTTMQAFSEKLQQERYKYQGSSR